MLRMVPLPRKRGRIRRPRHRLLPCEAVAGDRRRRWRGRCDFRSVQVMLYRTAGQFKTSYAADHALFPVRQDAWLLGVILLFVFLIFPLTASEFTFKALLIPVLIYSQIGRASCRERV